MCKCRHFQSALYRVSAIKRAKKKKKKKREKKRERQTPIEYIYTYIYIMENTTTTTANGGGTRLRSGRVLGNAGGFTSAAEAKAALLSGGGASSSSPRVIFSAENEQLLLRGITAVFERWAALTMAVVNEWGGYESKEKAESLRLETLDFLLKDSKKDSIEDFLYDCICEDFNVQLEDESHEEVGKVLRAMHEECGRGESSLVEKIEMQKLPKDALRFRDAIAEADMRNEGFKMAGVDEEMDDGDESESSSDEEMDDGGGDAEELAAGLKGMGKKKNEPDADGWTTV
jgi:pre-rRNA-processing protein TSR2